MDRNTQEEIRAHLMAASEEFRQLAAQHKEYGEKIDHLENLPHPSEAEQVEEVRLKKVKLHLKDQMEALILQQYKAQYEPQHA